jgi:hypothetical protein
MYNFYCLCTLLYDLPKDWTYHFIKNSTDRPVAIVYQIGYRLTTVTMTYFLHGKKPGSIFDSSKWFTISLLPVLFAR